MKGEFFPNISTKLYEPSVRTPQFINGWLFRKREYREFDLIEKLFIALIPL